MLAERFVLYALLTGCVGGVVLSFLGVYVVLRRIVFVGIALAETAAAGVALGYFLGLNTGGVSLLVVLSGIVFFWWPFRERALSRESVIGFVYCLAWALVIVLLSKSPMVEAAGVDLVGGNLLYVSGGDVVRLSAFAATVLAIHIVLFRRMVLCSFDHETAQALGLKVRIYDFIFYLTVGAAIAMTVKAAGLLFVFGSMVIPPMIALSIMRSIGRIFLASCIVTVALVAAGIVISIYADLPVSATIVLMYALVLAGVEVLRVLLTR